MTKNYKGFYSKVCLLCLLAFCISITGIGQPIKSWYGKVILQKGGDIKQPDGSLEEERDKEIELTMTFRQDGFWEVNYAIPKAGKGMTSLKNKSAKTNILSLSEIDKFMGTDFHIDGVILPDSSEIHCAVFSKGKLEGKLTLTLNEIIEPKVWKAETSIDGKAGSIKLHFEEKKWLFEYLNENGGFGAYLTNEGAASEIYFNLDQLRLSVPYDYLKGTFSSDSSYIKAGFYANDSLKLSLVFYLLDKNGMPVTAGVSFGESTGTRPPGLQNGLIWFIGIWSGLILFISGIILLLRKRKLVMDHHLQPVEKGWLQNVFPIIRVNINRSFFGRQKLLLLNDNGVYIFHKDKRKDVLNAWDCAEPVKNIPNISSLKEISWNDINKMTVERETGLGKVRFQIHHTKGKEYFVLPHFEMDNVCKACHVMLGDKLQTGLPIRLHNFGIWIKLLLASLLGTFLSYYLGQLFADQNWKAILVLIILIILFFYTIIRLFLIYDWLLDQVPRKNEQVIKKKPSDLSHRKPFRSLTVSILIRVTGGLVLLYSILIHFQQYLPANWENSFPDKTGGLHYLISGLGYFAAGLLLTLGLSFANRNPKSIIYKDDAKPILYLRSFQDDRETTFQPGTRLSSWMGVDPPYYQLNKYRFINDTRWVRFNRKFIRYFYNNHPVRLIRILLSWPVDTSEQQMELYFRNKGAFVAIGKPGEKIVTGGANRMYVTNEEWQDVVLDYLDRSQLVVLQPNRTEGVWWEIEKSVELVVPERLFYCMMNFRNRQNDYENFRIRFEALRAGITLPRFIGNSDSIYFFRFNADWQPERVQLKYHKWYKWPFAGNAADLESTLNA